jgi:hypothetical protein
MKQSLRVILAIVLMFTFFPQVFAQNRRDRGKRKARSASRVPVQPPIVVPPVIPPPVTHLVNVNPDGTFSPPIVTIRPGDTVMWQNLGRTDSVVQIANPLSAPGSDVCGVNDNHLDHRFNGSDSNEFTGPMRMGVSGIFALGPNGRGFRAVTSSARPCACELTHRCAPPFTEVGGVKLCPAEGPPYDLLPETWANPDITGVIIRLSWSDIQKDVGGHIQYDWNDLDRQLDLAVANGKVFTLDVRAGLGGTPDWIFASYAGPAGPGPVAPLFFKDWPDGPTPPSNNCGFQMTLGSPTHVSYRNLYVAMIRALANHVASDARWFQALAHVKVSGANYITSEARLPKRCFDSSDADDRLDTVGSDDCICNPQRWADASYTPAGLFQYYRVVENAIYEAFGRRKSLGYQLIQDGFPRVDSATNFLGDSLKDQRGNPLMVPTGTKADDLDVDFQTNTVLSEATAGRFLDPFGTTGSPAAGFLFVPQHSGLHPLPNDLDYTQVCSQQRVVRPNGRARFPINLPATQIPFTGVAGCPNAWAVRQGLDPNFQIMGFQTSNNEAGVDSPAAVESTLWNLTLNSNAVFIELYEQRLWEIYKLRRSGPLADLLSCDPRFLPVCVDARAALPNNPAPLSKNLYTWGEELHDRRRELVTSDLPDPFPTVYSHTFSGPYTATSQRVFFYINPTKCATTPRLRRVGTITITPPLLGPLGIGKKRNGGQQLRRSTLESRNQIRQRPAARQCPGFRVPCASELPC